MSGERVTDHADTIRRDATPEFVYAPSREEAQRLLDESYLAKFRAVPIAEWDALLAERQQLLDDLARAIETFDAGVQEAEQERDKLAADVERWGLREAEDGLVAENERLRAERQQAIDTLRDAPIPVNVDATPWDECYAEWWHKQRRAALVKLGEKQ